MSKATVEIERMVIRVENLFIESSSLEPTLLERIRMNLTQQKQKEAELLAVQEQLKLTDYEKIKSRLDYCMERLSVIPQEKEASARKRGELESGRKILEEKQRENQKITEKLQDKERNLAEKSI